MNEEAKALATLEALGYSVWFVARKGDRLVADSKPSRALARVQQPRQSRKDNSFASK
jgi:hypothetical protein